MLTLNYGPAPKRRKARDVSPWEDLVNHTDDLTELIKESKVKPREELHHRHRRIERKVL